MKINEEKQIRQDCFAYMKKVSIAYFFVELLTIVLPSINAYLIGNMANYLLNVDIQKIRLSLPMFLTAIILMVIGIPLFTMCQYLLLIKHSFDYDTYLVQRYFKKPLRKIQTQDVGIVLERIGGDMGDYCWNTVFLSALPWVIVIYVVFIGIIMSGLKTGPIFGVVLIILPAVSVGKAKLFGEKKATLTRKKSEYDEMRRSAQEDIVPSKDFLQSYDIDGLIIGKLRGIYLNYINNSGRKKREFESKMDALEFLLQHGIPFGVLSIGSWLVCRNGLTVGALLSGYLMLPSIEKCYSYFVTLVEEKKMAKEYLHRIALFYGEMEEDSQGDSTIIDKIEIANVSFKYNDDEQFVLENVTFALEMEGVQIIGANGCGKSTMASILGGLYKPSSGKILNQWMEAVSVVQLREAVSLQEQEGAIFTGTVEENLWIKPQDKEKAVELLKKFGFDKPMTYEVQCAGENLSPGEKKKLLLVRSLLKRARLYIFDEPLNHLDGQGRQAFLEELQKLKVGFVIISHHSLEEWKVKMKKVWLKN